MAGRHGRRTAARAAGQAKGAAAEAQFVVTLAALEVALRAAARRHPAFAARLRERDLVAQIRLAGRRRGRAYTIRGGKVRSRAGLHPAPDLTMTFDSAEVAAAVMRPGRDYLEFIDALKNFQMRVDGPDDLAVWFSETLQLMLTAGLEAGVDAGAGVRRFTSNTNGGPVFVYVRDGRILRITPIEFDDDDAEPWTIEARGHRFTPPRKTTVNSHTLAWKSPHLLARPAALSDEAGRLRPRRRAQPAEPRHLRLRAHQLGRGARPRGRRDQAREARPRTGRDHERQRLAPHLGQARLLAERPHPLLQHGRLVAGHAQPRQLGGLVLGGRAPLGPERAQRRRRDLRHRGGPAQARRDGGLLVERPRGDQRRLRRLRRHRPPPVAQGARHPVRPHRPVLQPHRGAAGRQVDRPAAGHGQRHGAGHRPRVDDRGTLRQGVRRRADRRIRRSGRPTSWARRTAWPRRRSGRRPRPASPRATCARSRARGGQGRRTSPPAASSASAAPAAPPPAPTGRAAWSASWPCRVWASPASTWAACSRARRSTRTSSSPATPRAASPATWTAPRSASTCTSACRSWPRSTPSRRSCRGSRSPRPCSTGTARRIPPTRSPSRGSSSASSTRRRATAK